MARIFVEQDGKVFEQMEREYAAQGYILDHHNGAQVIKYFEEWNPTVAITAASVKAAIDQMREKNLLHWKSQSQMNCEAAVKSSGLTQQHLDVLGQWLQSRKLIDTGDEGFSNRTQFINYMKGRDWTFENLDRGISYLQGNSRTALHWQPTPSQSTPHRGHNANHPPTSQDLRWMPKEECNLANAGRPNHANDPRFNGQAAREQRLAEERRLGLNASDAALAEDHQIAERMWADATAKLRGETHSETERIQQAARSAPGSERQRHEAAVKMQQRIRREKELAR